MERESIQLLSIIMFSYGAARNSGSGFYFRDLFSYATTFPLMQHFAIYSNAQERRVIRMAVQKEDISEFSMLTRRGLKSSWKTEQFGLILVLYNKVERMDGGGDKGGKLRFYEFSLGVNTI